MKVSSYEAPKLALVGTLEDLTRGSNSGNRTDKVFPVSTPVNQLTFS